MSSSQEDPIVHMRRLFPVGPWFNETGPETSQVVVPFGVRYAVPLIVDAAKGNKGNGPTNPGQVSVNKPTSPDGNWNNKSQTDDVPTQGTD